MGLIPVPDPTLLTTAQLKDSIASLRELLSKDIEYLSKRIDGLEDGSATLSQHQLLNEKVEQYHNSLKNDLDKAEANRKESLDRAALTIQTGLDKAERTLQVSLEKAERLLQVGLEAAEGRVTEKLLAQKELIDDARGVMDKYSQERATYITSAQLDLAIKTLSGAIQPLQSGKDRMGGRDTVIAVLCAAGLTGLVTILVRLLVK